MIAPTIAAALENQFSATIASTQQHTANFIEI
jgi:hypothetical protein